VLENLRFYSAISDWESFRRALPQIVRSYRELGASDGFSIDSFTFDDQVQFLSEVNYRKTMGLLAHQLAQRYASEYPWTLFVLEKKSISMDNVLPLSPEDARFKAHLLRAQNAFDGEALYKEFKERIN
jgi:hypothetical protein